MKTTKYLLAVVAALALGQAHGQMTVTLTPSVTAGNGTLVTDLTWSTNPPLTTGTPCTASSVPSTPQWTGAKAGSGSVTGMTFTADQRLTLACTFQGDSIATVTWVNPTQNTNGTAYSDPKLVRLKYTFNPTLTVDPAVAATGETHVDVLQTPTASTMRTITGLTQVGTFRVGAFAQNQANNFSAMSNVATKVFQGNVVVTQQVDLIVRSVPNAVSGVTVQ